MTGYPTIETRKAEDRTCFTWLVHHMTQEEQLELCGIIKKRDSMNENPVSWKDLAWTQGESERTKLLSRFDEIKRNAEERAKQEPPEAEALFKERWRRAETLRTLGRRLSETEGDELRELNAWLEDLRTEIQKRIKIKPKGETAK